MFPIFYDLHNRINSWFRDAIFRRLFLNAGKLLSASSVSALIGLLSVVLTARWLNPERYGFLALVLVYEQTIGKLVTFNAWQAIIKFGSEALHAEDRIGLHQLIKFGFTLDIVSAIAGTILAISISGLVVEWLGWDPAVRTLLMLYSIIILFNLNGTPIGVLRLFDRFDLLSYSTILSAIIKLIGVLFCIWSAQDILGFVAIYLLTGIVGQFYQLAASLWVLHKQNYAKFAFQNLKGVNAKFPGLWNYVWTTNINSTIHLLSRQADELIVAGFTTPAGLGIFKIAKQFSRVLPMIFDPLYQSIFPELAKLWSANNPKAFLSLVKRTTIIVSIPSLVGWVMFIILGKWLIHLTVGDAYHGVYSIAVVYMFALVIAICAFSLQPSMLAIGQPLQSLKSHVISTALYIAILIPAVKMVGVIGASASFVAYNLIWTALMLVYLKPSYSIIK